MAWESTLGRANLADRLGDCTIRAEEDVENHEREREKEKATKSRGLSDLSLAELIELFENQTPPAPANLRC
jgi:hypothetical protein